MASLNRVQIIGHLGRDPEVRRTNAGDPVVTFSLATGETWRDKQTGERKERTEWHTIVVFNPALAEVAEKYLKKGARVFVEGQLATRKWQGQDGADRWCTEVLLKTFGAGLILLDRAERAPPSEDAYGSARSASPGPAPASAARQSGDLDDDIPF